MFQRRRLFSAVFTGLTMVLGLGLPARASDFVFPMHSRETMALSAIEITGNTRTDPIVITRILGFEIGQKITQKQVDQARIRLEDSGFFRIVDVDFDDATEEAVLNVHVEEDLSTFYGPVVRYDRRFKYFLGGYLEQRNFRGHAEKLRLEATALFIQQGKLSWDRPWFLGQSGLHAHLETAYRQGDFVFRPTRFRKWTTGADVTGHWRKIFFITGGLTYGQFEQRDSLTWPRPWRGAGSPSGNEVLPASTQRYWVSEGALGLDSRSNPYYPLRGALVEGRVRHWSSRDFPSYLETTVDGRLFVPVPWKHHVLALHAWGRRTDGPAQLDNLLYFGGPETVRGEPYALREGDEGYLLSVEYRAPLFLMPISPHGELIGVGLHLFADAGDAWFHGADPGRAMQSAGAGLHLNLNTLQLRFEAARTREGHWGFEFMDQFNF